MYILKYIQAGIRLCMHLTLGLMRTLSHPEYIQVCSRIFKIYALLYTLYK